MTVPTASVVLLHGPGGGTLEDFAFLRPMLERSRKVLTIAVPDSMSGGAIDWNEVLADAGRDVTIVAIGGHDVEALGAARRPAAPDVRVVLIDPAGEVVRAGGPAVCVLASGARLGDVRRTLLERPARILSLVEDFIDGWTPAEADVTGARVAPPRIRSASDGSRDADVAVIDTVIVGAGFAGLGAGIRLARQGDESFVILERAHDVGGTWRDNVYPGVACDIPSHLYSYSFLPKPDWSGFFASGSEIHGYLQHAVRSEGLENHLRLGSEVLEMRWLADDRRWRVRTSAGDYLCRTLIVAAGRLSDARMPALPGLETFSGVVMHSSAWDDAVELRGQRVGVVGTGASAAQLIPRLAQTASSVVVFQRSAPYVVPRPDRAYTVTEQAGFAADPSAQRAHRDDLFWGAETAFAERMRVAGYIDRLRDRALGHLHSQLPDPGLRAAATPAYEIGCKRVIISNDYYPALASPTVTLEPSALSSVSGSTATSVDGHDFDLDVLVFATGFESTRPPFAARTFGTDGIRLADEWAAGMRAHASTTVHGFPNMFVLDGPNASLGHNSAVVMIEAQIDYVLAALDHRRSTGDDVLDVSLEAQDAYSREIDAKASSTVWLTGGCESWYVDERSGRLTLLWPDFAYAFQRRLSRFDPQNYSLVRALAQSSMSPA